MAALSRRETLITLAALTLAAPAAHSQSAVVLGAEGWLFAGWEDARRAATPAQAALLGTLSQACRILADASIEVALTLAPMRARIYADMLPQELRAGADSGRRFTGLLGNLRGMAPVVPNYVSLLMNLRGSQPRTVFFKADSHWTGTAAEACATELSSLLASRARLPATSGGATRLGALETRSQSPDLVPLLPEAARARYRPEIFHAHRVLPGPRGSLIEDARADIAIVGNSFMTPHLGFPAMLSNRLSRPVALHWLTARNGPWHTLLDYLGSETFRAARPRVVVWHFMEATMESGPDSATTWGSSVAMSQTRFLAELRRLVA